MRCQDCDRAIAAARAALDRFDGDPRAQERLRFDVGEVEEPPRVFSAKQKWIMRYISTHKQLFAGFEFESRFYRFKIVRFVVWLNFEERLFWNAVLVGFQDSCVQCMINSACCVRTAFCSTLTWEGNRSVQHTRTYIQNCTGRNQTVGTYHHV